MQERGTFQLVMGQGPRSGQIFELPRSTISIGRDPGNQIVINDPQISRQHARITPQGGLMILEDLGSTNGTTVNGLRISAPHTLAHGDEIGMGDNVTLIFYGWPASEVGETVVTPRTAYTGPPPATTPPAYQPTSPPAYEEAVFPRRQPPASSYSQPTEQDYSAFPEYYAEYPEEFGRNWALIGLGCVLVAIVMGLMIAIFIYFFAPASIVDPIADFLAGLGINVP
jgi:hypothetical protein